MLFRDEGDWQLEAGALVLADGGLCCIDNFGLIKEEDKDCIHEAMEQQTISVAKANMTTKLKSRCKVLAATTLKVRYNNNVSLSDNTAIKSPLLSRFDLVLTLLDAHSLAWDKLVSAKLLDGPPAGRAKRADVWSTKKLHLYFQHVQSLKPVLSSRAEKVIVSSRLWTYMSLLLRC